MQRVRILESRVAVLESENARLREELRKSEGTDAAEVDQNPFLEEFDDEVCAVSQRERPATSEAGPPLPSRALKVGVDFGKSAPPPLPPLLC